MFSLSTCCIIIRSQSIPQVSTQEQRGAAVEDPEWESLSYSASSLFASKSPIHIFRLELVHALAQGATININPLFFSIGLAHPFFCSYQEHTHTHTNKVSLFSTHTNTHPTESCHMSIFSLFAAAGTRPENEILNPCQENKSNHIPF